ncbi:MAG: hypothetical protein NC410_10560 [Oscillibacter sp.]|nr:hypothetical protein [Oscillibacter sp.]
MLDIKQTADGDVHLETGDLVYSESTEQHQQDILIADKGYYKESPDMGVGILNFLQDNDPENLLRTTRKQFVKDGMKVEKINIKQGSVSTTARYESSKS